MPQGEREEVRQIFAAKGFDGPDLERVVAVITSDPELWTEAMMSEELGYGSTEPNEFRAALATLAAFLTVGFLPLMVFAYDLAAPGDIDNAFTWSVRMTAVAFLVVVGIRSRFVDQAWWRSALETSLSEDSPRCWRTRQALLQGAWPEQGHDRLSSASARIDHPQSHPLLDRRRNRWRRLKRALTSGPLAARPF